MRVSVEKAYENWAATKVMSQGGEMLSRVEWANRGITPDKSKYMNWAFHAGWYAALASLTTKDI